jgi:hypothetical protein
VGDGGAVVRLDVDVARPGVGRCAAPLVGGVNLRRLGDPGDPAKRGVGGPGQLGLDLGDGAARGLAPLDGHELEQVARPVQRGAAAAAERRIHQPDRGVPADQALVGQVAHPSVDPHRVARREDGDGPFGQFGDGPGARHGTMMTLSS